MVDGIEHAAEVLDLRKDPIRFRFDLIGEFFDEPASAQRIGGLGDVCFMGQHLLRAQGQLDCIFGRQCQRLIHAVGVQRLRAAEHRRHGLIGHANHVVHRLLPGEAHAGGLGMAAQFPASFVLGADLITHVPGPDSPGRPELGDFFEEVVVYIEKETQPRRESVHVHAARDALIYIAHAVGQRERQLLSCVRARLADVIAADAHGVPFRHVLGAILDGIDHQPDALARREDVFVLSVKLLEDIVLQGAAQLRQRHALILSHANIKRQQHCRRPVNGHRRADLCQINAVKQPPHVVQ